MNSEPNRRLRLADLIIPIAAVAYAIYYIASVRTFPFQAQMTGLLLGSIIGILCIVFFGRFAWEAWHSGIRSGWEDLFGDKTIGPRRAAFAGLILLSIVAAPWGGFTLTTFLFLLASLTLMGVRPLARALIVATVASIAGWLFFIVLLGTRFPRGPFEQLMSQLI